METTTFYISPTGNDRWSGSLDAPTAAKTDGPFASIPRALKAVREEHSRGTLVSPAVIYLRGGTYRIRETIVLTMADSVPVTLRAYENETPVIDGGECITGFSAEKINGHDVWTASIPQGNTGWYFRELFVNGQRRPRARLPKVGPTPSERGFFWMESVPDITLQAELFDGSRRFQAKKGDMRPWKNITDAEIVVLHYWTEERMPIASFDDASGIVTSERRSIFALKDDFKPQWAKYYIDNIIEGLTEPGEWYLDKEASKLYYYPRPGETPENTEIAAPRVTALMRFDGDPDTNRFIENITLRGITFRHADWIMPRGGAPVHDKVPDIEYAASAQGASHAGGAIEMTGTRGCAFEDCTVEHVGLYAFNIMDGCIGNRFARNTMSDLGAGGIKQTGSRAEGPTVRRTGNSVIADNHIHHGGQVFHSATGIMLMDTFGNEVSRNHIHDFYYSGISSGWVWGFADSVSKDNHFIDNHIHDLGFGWLSDMGGIYLLGVQPGTIVRGNIIYNIENANYGGWGIYLDEGSAHVIVENNICHHTACEPFHMHYGRECIVRNNIFIAEKTAAIALGREGTEVSLTIERNILIVNGTPIYAGGYGTDIRKRVIIADANCLWDVRGKLPVIAGNAAGKEPKDGIDLAAWRAQGNDIHTVIADPKIIWRDGKPCAAADSPALSTGFRPFTT
ncbi:MAG: right-handed parallel beta-helix repeat-containing protein [Spirochaetota bacterium]